MRTTTRDIFRSDNHAIKYNVCWLVSWERVSQKTDLGPWDLFLGPKNVLGPKRELLKSFELVFNVRKTKKIARFDGLEPQVCKDIKGTEVPKYPKKFRDS